MPQTADQFAELLIAAGLATVEELETLWSTLPAGQCSKDADTFADALIECGKLTSFQAEELLSGSTRPLVLGDYILLDKIGAGGMGQVFKARHRHMDRLAAIKLLPEPLTKDAEAVQRFQREVRAAAKLSHPHIVQTYDASVQRGVWYLAMEYVDGPDLARVVASDGPLPVDRAVDYIRQVANGLAFAHENGIVHRDIKPANLLLDNRGTIKVLDMGLARFEDPALRDALTHSGQLMGTVDYMAPEQAFSVRNADSRADIYSLGCTLFRLLTGKSMYEGDTIVQRLMAHQSMPIPLLAAQRHDVPRELVAIFERMVAKKPEERFQSMKELDKALASIDTSSIGRTATASHVGPTSRIANSVTHSTATANTTATAELSSTVTLSQSEVTTEGISDRSIQLARMQGQGPQALARPWWRARSAVVTVGSAVAILLAIFAAWSVMQRRGIPKIVLPDNENRADASQSLPGHVKTQPPLYEWPADTPKPAVVPFTADQAKQHQAEWSQYLNLPVEWENSIGMKFRLIPPGEFVMGSTEEERMLATAAAVARKDDEWRVRIASEAPRHRVVLTRPFYMGQHEVTQSQYERLIGTNPSALSKQGNWKSLVEGIDTATHPVTEVYYREAVQFCLRLNESEKLSATYKAYGDDFLPVEAVGYRLPSEAQWEFACRAGTTSLYCTGDDNEALGRVGWHQGNSGSSPASVRTHSVGELAGNAFGLFDMHGNAWEWTQDWWREDSYGNADQATVDPQGAADSPLGQKVVRGGYFNNYSPYYCRSAGRFSAPVGGGWYGLGLRLVLPVEAVKELRRNIDGKSVSER